MLHFFLTLLACAPAPVTASLPGAPTGPDTTARVRALADELAAIRELPEPSRFPIRELDETAWARHHGSTAISNVRSDHALALTGLGLIENTRDLAQRQTRQKPDVVWDRDLGALLSKTDGLDQDALVLAAANSVQPTCKPVSWTWDAHRVASAVQDGMAVALAWQRDLHQAGLPQRGLTIDPALPLNRWRTSLPPQATALDHDDQDLRAVGTDVVQRLLAAGEWRSTDMACNRLPSSTAALLHPTRWQEGQGPEPIGPADVPEWSAAGWEHVHGDRIGELTFASWLAQTARVGTPAEARELAAGWRGDAVSIWRHSDSTDLRAAWTLNLAPDARRDLARLLHGRVLTDGRMVDVRPGPGDALVLLIGGSGHPIVTVLEAAQGGTVSVRLGPAVDAAAWERTLRLEANTATTDDGVARIGETAFPLDDGWVIGRRGMDGEVLSLRHRGSRLRLDLYESPTLLVGPSLVAAERIARLMAGQQGMSRPVRLRQIGSCTVATVLGRDRNGNAREIRVHAIPGETGTLIARANYAPRDVPINYHRLARTLEDTQCRSPVAQRN